MRKGNFLYIISKAEDVHYRFSILGKTRHFHIIESSLFIDGMGGGLVAAAEQHHLGYGGTHICQTHAHQIHTYLTHLHNWTGFPGSPQLQVSRGVPQGQHLKLPPRAIIFIQKIQYILFVSFLSLGIVHLLKEYLSNCFRNFPFLLIIKFPSSPIPSYLPPVFFCIQEESFGILF